ncbi:MAG: cytochrome c oxidase subunit II [Rhodospirillales bacterium]|nr:cytochrome c oxidase subunit II [Rhodospirillales bacterium]
MLKRLFALIPAGFTYLLAGQALADVEMRSSQWQMWLQKPMSESAVLVHDLNLGLMILETVIVLFVLGLMVYILIRFNEKNNPVPSKNTHNTMLEVVWTALPILILVVVAVPSLKALYFTDSNPDVEMNIKVNGNQWYWSYSYPDNGDIAFDSIIVPDGELKPGQPRMLSVDNPLVLPANTKIRFLIASNDVIHNFAMPSLAIKVDATPGRVNEVWTEISEVGNYYAMCSELCGVNHGFMPIHIKAVSKEAFAKWVEEAKEKFADNSSSDYPKTVRLAEAVNNAR